MTASIVVLAVAVIALAIYALVRRSRRTIEVAAPADEFAELSEAERCDYVFALSALDDPSNANRLRRALDDPSEVVAIAAARSLVLAGHRDEVEALLARRNDARSHTIASALELLA